VAAEVAAVGRVEPVGAHHHDHGVPAHIGAQALFELDVAGAAGLLLGIDGVHITGRRGERQVDVVVARVLEHLLDQEVRAFGALAVDDGREGVQPLLGFLRVRVVCGGTEKRLRLG